MCDTVGVGAIGTILVSGLNEKGERKKKRKCFYFLGLLFAPILTKRKSFCSH